MALDTNIPLRLNPQQTNSPLAALFEGQKEARAESREQTRSSSKETTDTQQAELNQLKLDEIKQNSEIRSLAIGASRVLPFLEGEQPDVEGALSALNRRRESLIETGRDTTQTDQAISIIQGGDMEAIKNLARGAEQDVSIARQMGIFDDGTSGVKTPASVILADEIGKARSSGDTQRLNDLLLASKSLEKGQRVSPEGKIVSAEGSLKALLERAEAQEAGKLEAKLELEPSVAEAVAVAKEVGKEKGIAEAELNSRVASFPNLEVVVNELSDLGKIATFTLAGQVRDAARRQAGLEVGSGAIARKEYMSKVDNEILPLLRQTFGAQFTEREGQSLKATLGDPDASPAEKDAVLKSFIATKAAQIETLKRQTGEDGIRILPDEVEGEEQGQEIDYNDLPE